MNTIVARGYMHRVFPAASAAVNILSHEQSTHVPMIQATHMNFSCVILVQGPPRGGGCMSMSFSYPRPASGSEWLSGLSPFNIESLFLFQNVAACYHYNRSQWRRVLMHNQKRATLQFCLLISLAPRRDAQWEWYMTLNRSAIGGIHSPNRPPTPAKGLPPHDPIAATFVPAHQPSLQLWGWGQRLPSLCIERSISISQWSVGWISLLLYNKGTPRRCIVCGN